MRKLFIGMLAVALVVGMSFGVMAQDNIADIDQTSNDKPNAAGAEAYLEQIGLGNEAYLDQNTGSATSGWPTFADVIQDGDNNKTDITQTLRTGSSRANVYLDQIGDDNEAYLTQDFRGIEAKIMMDQLGSRNLVDLEQTGGYSGSYKFNTFIMTQDGDDNMVVGVGKNQNGVMWLKEWDSAKQVRSNFVGSQIGDENKIGLYQGHADSAVINQNGDKNEALLWQGEDAGHTANISQNGDSNISEVIQTSN